jgi:hypothetical protein
MRLGGQAFASASFAVVALALAVALVACPGPKVPKGPPPEYEDPPAPSWIDAGDAGRAAEGSSPPAVSLPGADKTPPQPAID